MNTDERVSDNKSAGESTNGEKEPAGEYLSSGTASVGDVGSVSDVGSGGDVGSVGDVGDVGSVGGATSSESGQPEEIGDTCISSSYAQGHDNAQQTLYDTMESSGPVDEVFGFNPSPSYIRHSETFATLQTEIIGKNLLVENAEIELNKKKTALAIESLQQSLASIDYISFDQAMKIASEKAGFETESDQRSYDELLLSRDAAEYEAEEYFSKYMFNEELAYAEQGIRERRDIQ